MSSPFLKNDFNDTMVINQVIKGHANVTLFNTSSYINQKSRFEIFDLSNVVEENL